MSDKPLSYSVTIKSLSPIPNKDRIVLASFEETEWRVIVPKDDFRVGDLAIYVEPESILPVWPEFAFLEKRCFSKKYSGYKIKSMKMGEAYSEGIAFTLDSLKDRVSVDKPGVVLDKELSIRRVEDEAPEGIAPSERESTLKRVWKRFLWRVFRIKPKKRGFVSLDYPSDVIPKTDETQVQSLPGLIEEAQGKQVYVSTKVDGMSSTAFVKDGEFYVCSRNMIIYRDRVKRAIKTINSSRVDSLRNQKPQIIVAAKWDLPRVLNDSKGWAIQWETAGPGIQKNRMGLKDYEGFIFNLYGVEDRKFAQMPTLLFFCDKHNYSMVPDVQVRTFDWKSVDDLLEASKGSYSNGTPREGIVIRAFDSNSIWIDEPTKKMHAMWSFKVINPDYRLKYQDE
jgi:hypothetical protein